MNGLPTETMDDVAGIAALGQKIVDCYYQNPNKPKGKGVNVSISVACFVPKPFTPFQWEPQDTVGELGGKAEAMGLLTTKKISLRWHDASTSFWRVCLPGATAGCAPLSSRPSAAAASGTHGRSILTFKHGLG